MMEHELSFAKINILTDNIAEVIVEQGIEITLEMAEEYNNFLTERFPSSFALLINKVNEYTFAFEAQLTMASHLNLAAIAVITYKDEDKDSVIKLASLRALDGWNLKTFDGLNLGRQTALLWLQGQLRALSLGDSL